MHMMAQLKDIRAQVFKAKKCISSLGFLRGINCFIKLPKKNDSIII